MGNHEAATFSHIDKEQQPPEETRKADFNHEIKLVAEQIEYTIT